MEFFDWSLLLSFSGAVFAVAVLTQITKEIPLIKSIPTQLWSYLLAAAVQIAARYFSGGLDASAAVLAFINAALISLASNGGYEAIGRIRENFAKTDE